MKSVWITHRTKGALNAIQEKAEYSFFTLLSYSTHSVASLNFVPHPGVTGLGTSLVVHWLRLCSQCRRLGFNLGSGN